MLLVTRHVAKELQCKGVRVLVEEDNIANQMLMKEYFDILEINVAFAAMANKRLPFPLRLCRRIKTRG